VTLTTSSYCFVSVSSEHHCGQV